MRVEALDLKIEINFFSLNQVNILITMPVDDDMVRCESSCDVDMDASEAMIDDDKYSFENTSDDDTDRPDNDKIMSRSHAQNPDLDPDLIADMRRDGRKSAADFFRRSYTYGPSKEQKTCIWSGGCTYSWPGKSSGIIWVGVHGMNSTCVVTRTGYLDVARAHGSYIYKTKDMVLRYFRKTAISEIEDLEDQSSKLCKKFGQSFKKPFGIVSGIPCIDKVDTECGREASSDEYESDEYESNEYDCYEYDSDDSMLKLLLEQVHSHQPSPEYDVTKTIGFLQEKLKSNCTSTVHETLKASSVECDEKKAVEFLKEKMSCDATFTVDETIQTAISAFQHLFQKKFKANEIEVSVTYPEYWITPREAKYEDKDPTIKELEMGDIEDLLAIINEPGSGGSSSGGSSSGGSSSGGSSSGGSSSGGQAIIFGEESEMSDIQAIIFVKELEMSDIQDHLLVMLGSEGSSTGSSSSD